MPDVVANTGAQAVGRSVAERGPTDAQGTPANRPNSTDVERVDTVVIGGGQSGLSVGYHLQRLGMPFLILDAEARTGDVWRRRWDSLRLFTPAAFSGLDGFPFPAARDTFPTKEAFADYLEAYAQRFALPIEHGARVDRLGASDGGFAVCVGKRTIQASQVIVAMSNYQRPSVPAFAVDLDPKIVQLHSSAYRNPSQLPSTGTVLIVGSGNSGAEIARELAGRRPVVLAGRYPGALPFPIDSPVAHAFLIRLALKGAYHRILTIRTPIGRRLRPKILAHSPPLIRTKAKHLDDAGVRRLPRVDGTERGMPRLADGTVLDVGAVVWCTGYRPNLEWIDLPLRWDGSEPVQRAGVVDEVPGLYFVGRHFQYALSSEMIHGVGRDAARAARLVVARTHARRPRATA